MLRHSRKIRCWLIAAYENYWPWFVAAMTALTANWAASAIQDGVGEWWSGGPVGISFGRALTVASFILFCILFIRNKGRLFAPRTRYLTDNEAPGQRECLFLFLSDPGPQNSGILSELKLDFTHLGTDLQQIWDAKAADPRKRWNWEMPLRAIWHHVGTLNTVVLVCSDKSIEQAHDFLNICLRYERLKKQVRFCILGCKKCRPFLYDPQTITRIAPFKPGSFKNAGVAGVSFDSFDMLTRALLHALRKLRPPDLDII